MDMTGTTVEIHMRTDAKNLVTTASTTHLPNQKETIHMIQMLRHEATSGQMDDLAHVSSGDMMADVLTKIDCPTGLKALKQAVDTGWIPNADAQPNFRDSLKTYHKAFLCEWVGLNISHVPGIFGKVPFRIEFDELREFCGIDLREEFQAYLMTWVNPYYGTENYSDQSWSGEISNCYDSSC